MVGRSALCPGTAHPAYVATRGASGRWSAVLHPLVVATDLASPTLPTDGTAGRFLEAARTDFQTGRAAEAQEALERAETRLLDGPVGPAQGEVLDHTPTVLDIGVARRDLAMRDWPGAIRAIDDALAAPVLVGRPVAAAPNVIPAPQVPRVSYALLPGHWQLDGARYVWVPPETRPRRVEDRAFAQAHYVWRGGEWTWVPSHFRVE